MKETMIHDLLISNQQILTIPDSYFEEIKEAQEIIRKRAIIEYDGIIPKDNVVVIGKVMDNTHYVTNTCYYPELINKGAIRFFVYISEGSELIPIGEYLASRIPRLEAYSLK